MIRVRIFDKKSLKEFSKYFVNEYCAMKYARKLRHSKNLQVVGELEYVPYNDVQPKK